MKLIWEAVAGEDTLALRIGRVELARLYRTCDGVSSVVIDGSLEKEFPSVEEGKAAVEAHLAVGPVIYCYPDNN